MAGERSRSSRMRRAFRAATLATGLLALFQPLRGPAAEAGAEGIAKLNASLDSIHEVYCRAIKARGVRTRDLAQLAKAAAEPVAHELRAGVRKRLGTGRKLGHRVVHCILSPDSANSRYAQEGERLKAEIRLRAFIRTRDSQGRIWVTESAGRAVVEYSVIASQVAVYSVEAVGGKLVPFPADL